MSYFCYIARCSDESLYIGSCSDLRMRENEHNKGKGSKFTMERRPVKIIYSEEFITRTNAMRREKQIKKWSRIKKERLAVGKHPTKD